MRTAGRRVQRLTKEGQRANDELAYVVEENVLAWRIVRLHGAGADAGEPLRATEQRAAPPDAEDRDRVGGTMTPLTQIMAACAMSAVIVVALWQSSRRRPDGGRLRRLHHRDADAAAADQAPGRRDGADHARPGGAGARRRPGRRQAPPNKAAATAVARASGDIELRRRDAALRAPTRPTALDDLSLHHRRRRDGGAGRPFGRRQVLAGQPAAALHRADRGRAAARRRAAARVEHRLRCAGSSRW